MSLGRARILDAALALAADRHWEALRLRDVAEELGVGLSDLHPCLGEKEDLVDWFWDRADAVMLSQCRGPDFDALEFSRRYETCVLAWLSVPLSHRRTFREMLYVRMEPGHLHIQLPTLLRVSRTVQWMREACGRRGTFLRRATEEVVLSSLFVSALADSLNDDSLGGQRSRDRLQRHIRWAVSAGRLWPTTPPRTPHSL
ncbi:AcrR family transcriptional regulator [Natronospira proteinivora]|uniref:AcrR family transcriptional regulator n=1 Tax=Natronospira proteinivora TaxID=1807133 RepID=A0ABT1G9Q7_9GAMM|nr:TetR/AcrR family transcriptional regulator [Natronospira proteinivora]MCP1728040.1 AcrR family transcriptional regulator [Natronospira proteinivora]